MTWKEKLACFFGFHPRNPRRLIVGEAYYVTRYQTQSWDGIPGVWEEKCPRCGCWHQCGALAREIGEESRRRWAARLRSSRPDPQS